VSAPLRGELRYGLELARLLADERFRRLTRADEPRPVLLIPGFLAGDTSLTVLAGWLRRRGHEVRGSGMWVCTAFRASLEAPLAPGMPTLAVHSRSDGIVDWRACLDPYAECVEIDGSHCGMAVNAGVYRELEPLLERTEAVACSR